MEIHKCSFENAQISFFRNVFDKTMYEVIDLQPNIQGQASKEQSISSVRSINAYSCFVFI